MVKDMTDYFVGEKQESMLFILAACMAIGLAVWLWTQGHRLRFMALPLVVVALMQLVVGVTIFARTEAQVAHLSTQLSRSPTEFKQAETERMQTVMANFKVYKTLELLLLVLGAGLIAFFSKWDAATAIGIGLVLQAGFTLALDLFAQARGESYLRALAGIAA
jgi:membrane protein YdbS with pleckstrin-like domain